MDHPSIIQEALHQDVGVCLCEPSSTGYLGRGEANGPARVTEGSGGRAPLFSDNAQQQSAVYTRRMARMLPESHCKVTVV